MKEDLTSAEECAVFLKKDYGEQLKERDAILVILLTS